jgi:hypothetical protein
VSCYDRRLGLALILNSGIVRPEDRVGARANQPFLVTRRLNQVNAFVNFAAGPMSLTFCQVPTPRPAVLLHHQHASLPRLPQAAGVRPQRPQRTSRLNAHEEYL